MMKTNKPWGNEDLLYIHNSYMFKHLFMKEGHACSLQFHKEKTETIFVISGILELHIGSSYHNISKTVLEPGDYYTIQPKTIHRMVAIVDCKYLEASTSHPDDVVRIEDEYGRV